MFYPVFIDLRSRPVLVVGGGPIAERKVEALIECGAAITLVSPELTPRLQDLALGGGIHAEQRPFQTSDLDGVVLAISATNDRETQEAVAAAARARNVLVNTVDEPDLCTFIVPAIVRRGDVVVAISTSGKSPALAAALRARIGRMLTPGVARAAQILGSIRDDVHRRFPDSGKRKEVFERIVESGILDWINDYDDVTALERVRGIVDGFS